MTDTHAPSPAGPADWTAADERTARAALAAIPHLHALPRDEIGFTRLGAGGSNLSLLVDTPLGRFVLRLPRPDRSGYVDRASEVEASEMAGASGLGAAIAFADPRSGILLTEWIPEAPTMTPELFRADPLRVRAAGRLLARLHASPVRFRTVFDVFALLARYGRLLGPDQGGPDPLSDRVWSAIEQARSALTRSPLPLVPSHCDPVPANFLAAPGRLVLIDWEYASMNDPAWDLAYLSLEAGLEGVQRDELLAAYDHPRITQARLGVFVLLAASLASLWGRLPTRADEVIDWQAWTRERTEIAEAIAAGPELGGWLGGLLAP